MARFPGHGGGGRLEESVKLASKHLIRAAVAAALFGSSAASYAALGFTVDANGWPNAAHRDAAVAAIQSAVNRYNAYGDFGNANIWVYYNAGIPTAQASYLGSIGFGGTYPNERVMMHEIAHYLGSGTYGTPWNGPRTRAIIDQFDGIEANLNGDSAHFWPYGLNYDSEGSEINKQRQVAVLYAQRADMGIGSTAVPGATGTVALTASDPLGESGFNYASRWSDSHFAHSTANYVTNNHTLRTPASGNSFSFAGNSLTVNNTNGINGGLLYKGTGSTGLITIKNLILDGGYVRHANSSSDLFQLAGRITLQNNATLDAGQGAIKVIADIDGSGSLTKAGAFPVLLTGTNTYAGDTFINAGSLRVRGADPVASYTFDNVSGNTVINAGTGSSPMNGTLANGAVIVPNGRTGNAVSLSGGASVDINNAVVKLDAANSWTVTAWVKTTTAGGTILTKGDGSGWNNGNTIFYLGDGTGPGSGGVPSAVRYAGGFFQTSSATPSVLDNNWHQITYVNNAGTYAIYVDGVQRSLSPGNASFGNDDVGSIIRLGVSTNTVASDGTVNFNGLLDNVQFYNQALSPLQAAALFEGRTLIGTLPISTTVHLAAGATLDLAGVTQQVAGVNGVAGSSVLIPNGSLIVDSAGDSTFSGNISGATGTLVKAGTGTFLLRGSNSYTGSTTIADGTLVVGNNARTPILVTPTAGADIVGGTLVFDYAGGTSPAATVQSILDAGFDLADPFSTGQLRSTQLPDDFLLGWIDNAAAQTLSVRATIAGDANLDLAVDFSDLLAVAAAFDQSNAVWANGDFNYDQRVDFTDLLTLARHYGATPTAFAGDWALAQSLVVPEPAALGLLAAGGVLLRRRRPQ